MAILLNLVKNDLSLPELLGNIGRITQSYLRLTHVCFISSAPLPNGDN